jgi:hypothetical protein
MFRIIVGSPKVRAIFEDGDEILTAQQAAELAGRSNECIRVWCRQADIGCFDGTLNRYFVSKRSTPHANAALRASYARHRISCMPVLLLYF